MYHFFDLILCDLSKGKREIFRDQKSPKFHFQAGSIFYVKNQPIHCKLIIIFLTLKY